jgi:hypothetical protein
MQAGTVVENIVCSFIVMIGIKTLPAFSILVGEATISHILGHVIILPSPIGIELMEFPAKMVYIIKSDIIWKQLAAAPLLHSIRSLVRL